MISVVQLVLRKVAVRSNVTLGRNFHVGPGSVIWAPESLVIGNDVYVGKHVTIEVDGKIGDGTMIANSVGVIGRRDHDSRQIGVSIRNADWVGSNPGRLSDPVTVGSDVWIGYGAIILSGCSIGDSAIVGAGAVVINDVPPNAVVVGSPARQVGVRFRDDEFKRHWAALRRSGVRESLT